MPIHPTAIVDRRAELDASVDVGPYVVIDGPVHVGPRTRIMAHGCLTGDTRLGADNVLFPGVGIGQPPQDLAYADAPSGVRIGDRNTFREHAEVHRGTQADTVTTIGSDVYVMSKAHVAHNCRIADRAIIAGGVLVAGHCDVGEGAFISGNCVVHQYVRIGRLALMRGLSRTSRDVPPFAIMDGTHTIRGVNRVGLQRAGFDGPRIRTLTKAYRVLFRVRRNLTEAMVEVEATHGDSADVQELLAFIRAATRGVAMGPPRGLPDEDGTR